MAEFQNRFTLLGRAKRKKRSITRRLRRLWKRYIWPMPLARLRGYARLRFGDYEFDFHLGNFHERDLTWQYVLSRATQVRQGKWEKGVIDFLKKVLQPGDIFFDVGASMGIYTLLASRLVQPGGKVYSFEPNPIALRLLRKNLATASVSNVTVIPYAVTDREGSAWLDTILSLGDSRVTQNRGAAEIQTVTLQSFCEKHSTYPSVIKIDVEGGEADLFAGGIAELKRTRVIVLEFHERQLREGGVNPSAFFKSLFTLSKRIIVLDRRSGEGGEPGTELTKDISLTGNVHLAIL